VVIFGAGILLVGGSVTDVPAAELPSAGQSAVEQPVFVLRPAVPRRYREMAVPRPDLRDGWHRFAADGYTFGLPGDMFVITADDLGTEAGRARVEAAWTGSTEVLLALEVRVRDEELAALAVEIPWTPGAVTITMRIARGSLDVPLLTETADQLATASATATLVDERPAFRIDGAVGTVEVRSTVGDHDVITQEGGRAVSVGYAVLAEGRRLELAVTTAGGDASTATDAAAAILASWSSR
jgi:hypothetical protein